ncbi:MAG TPA: HAMP domain-containing sensor histidine kinase, partial [bacterium]|nr:HAMP domain-containing sensor histidine kinase [bacterium]
QERLSPVIDTYLHRLAGTGLPLDALARDLARDVTTRDIAALVLDADGRPLASGKILPDDMDPAPVRADAVRRALRDGSLVTDIRRVEGGRELVTYIPLWSLSPTHGAVGLIQLNTPLTDVDRSLARLRLALVATSMTTLLASGVLALLSGGYLAAPLETLAATCTAISRGDLRRRSELPHGRDEVGRLAASFDEMVHKLDAAFTAQQRFVTDAAHQLKTPLTVLSGHLELLERMVIADPTRVLASYATMREQTARLDHALRRLITLSALDAGAPLERREVNLQDIASHVIEDFRVLAGARQLRLVCSDDARADVDPDQIREALANLVDNAIHHTAPTGTITIEVGGGRITVRDDGVGIPPDRLPRIFDRFYRYPPTSEGSGLGLAIVRSIVESHGGRLSAESTPGRGTTLTLTVPSARM